MAATAQSNPYDVFIRKIGWSVGLEKTFERVHDLVGIYVEEREISSRAWEELVHGKEHGWGLKNDLIADFFSSIELLRRQKREIHALPCLDALALARNELTAAESLIAEQFILGSQLILSDGDVFLNCLAASFARTKTEELLRQMILRKRKAALRAIRAPQLVEKAIKAIAIDVQASNVGGAGVGRALSDQKRREPLTRRTEPLSQRSDPERIEISEDYFRKVLGRREGWARSLEMLSEGGTLTPRAESLLRELRKLTESRAADAIAYWPFEHELRRIHLQPSALGIPAITFWDHIIAVRKGLELAGPGDDTGLASRQEVLALFSRMYETYQQLSPKRALLRKEIPVAAVIHGAVACYAARGRPLPPVQTILKEAGAQPESNVVYRESKNFGATVSLKK